MNSRRRRPPAGTLLLAALLAGCAAHGTRVEQKPAPDAADAADAWLDDALVVPVIDVGPPLTPDWPADELWQRVRNGFGLDQHEDRQPVRQWVQFYATHPDHVLGSAKRARPFLWHIVEEVEARGMPLELALVPMVESGFNPHAYSYKHASGLWQFIPHTASRFGLSRNWWYDGRRDVLSSTTAALDYLEWLHTRFGNWLLALAAYNAGEGRVGRAIERARRRGKPTDFWHLDLPAETDNYVPKLLALRRLVATPQDYALEWPELPNEPATALVSLPGQVELKIAAEMIDMTPQALRAINPGFKRWATHPDGPHHLLVPVEHVQALRLALSEADPSELVTWRRHRVAPGDVLSRIARRYDTTVSLLRQVNGISGSLIHPGDYLLVPADGPAVASAASVRYRVRSGDSLWSIARSFDVSVSDLRDWNGLDGNGYIHPGQELRIILGTRG